MIVVSIISLLVAAATFSAMRALDRSRVKACVATMQNIRKGLELYQTEESHYPDTPDVFDMLDQIKPHLDLNVASSSCKFQSYSTDGNAETFEMETTVNISGGRTVTITMSETYFDEVW